MTPPGGRGSGRDGTGSPAAAAAARLTGARVTRERSLGAVVRLTLDDGRAVIAKSGPSVPAEVAGLRWLHDAGAVAVPAVHGTDRTGGRGPGDEGSDGTDWLVTDAVDEGRSTPAAAEDLGRSLAALHAAGAPAFGAPPPGGPADAWIGLAPMRNVATDGGWPGWFAEHRVRPYVRGARDAGALDARGAAAVDAVLERLPELAGPDEPPARLHGDLWAGNVLWGRDGRARLIDPAAHGGHRESDLAMLDLFSAAHLDRIVAAYDEAAPLAPGWRERVGLHQLFPLLVHAQLFGGGYGRRAVAVARALVGG